MPGAASCCTQPCDGSRCHIECAVSTTDKDECTCHCHGEFHGLGARAAGGAKVPLRERINRTRRAHQLRRLSDDELEEKFRAVDWTDLGEVERVAREVDRRERTGKTKARAKSRRQDEQAEWHQIANAEMESAESSDYVRGVMFSKQGARLAEKRGVTELDLWRMSRARADVYASEELQEWWDRHDGGHPRTMPGEVRRQRAASNRSEREAYEEHRSPYPGLVP